MWSTPLRPLTKKDDIHLTIHLNYETHLLLFLAILLNFVLAVHLRGDWRENGDRYENYETWVFFKMVQISQFMGIFFQKEKGLRDMLCSLTPIFPKLRGSHSKNVPNLL